MISREILNQINKRLVHFDNVTLVGPLEVGKTTIAHQIAAQWQSKVKYLDLDKPIDRRLLNDSNNYLSSHIGYLFVLDEIQRAPNIFKVLRGQIDERRRKNVNGGKFLVIGSASLELLRQESESLAGRASLVELMPLNAREVNGYENCDFGEMPQNTLDRLWLRGGMPLSYLDGDNEESLQWRHDYIQMYLERHLPKFDLNVNADTMYRFWRMIANDQGEFLNAQRYARSLGMRSGHTVVRYLKFLRQLLLVRILPSWNLNTEKRLVKSPRLYVRDSGILHALMSLRTMDDLLSHSVAGKSWEGFVIENLLSAAAGKATPYFYCTGAGAQIDLILEFVPNNVWAFSIRLSSAPTIERGFYNAIYDIDAERNFIVHKGKASYTMRHGVTAMTLFDAMKEVSSEVNG